MTAERLVILTGMTLVGQMVNTEAIGDWPGGVCEVTEVDPDPASPEIAFNVRDPITGEEIGVFDYEEVQLLD